MRQVWWCAERFLLQYRHSHVEKLFYKTQIQIGIRRDKCNRLTSIFRFTKSLGGFSCCGRLPFCFCRPFLSFSLLPALLPVDFELASADDLTDDPDRTDDADPGLCDLWVELMLPSAALSGIWVVNTGVTDSSLPHMSPGTPSTEQL